MKTSKNLEMLSVVARGLRDLKDRVVFVGGATVDMYVTNLAGEPLRATDDVDCVIGITGRVAYHELEEKLRALGFAHPMEDARAPICRWKFSEILVDVMPMDAGVLGFSNRWYPEGVEHAERRTLPDGQEIAIFTLPYFLASKVEAFLGRGRGDFYGSEDIEDIIAVIDGAEDVREKVFAGPETVKAYLREQFAVLLRNELFEQSVTGHLGPKTGAGRIQRVLEVLRELAALSEL